MLVCLQITIKSVYFNCYSLPTVYVPGQNHHTGVPILYTVVLCLFVLIAIISEEFMFLAKTLTQVFPSCTQLYCVCLF